MLMVSTKGWGRALLSWKTGTRHVSCLRYQGVCRVDPGVAFRIRYSVSNVTVGGMKACSLGHI